MAEKKFVTLGTADEVPEGEVRVFETEEHRIAVCNVEGTLYAVDDVCTHDGGPLGEGTLDDHAVMCPRHGAMFDVRTGEVVRLPASAPIETYRVRIENDEIQVELEEED